MVLESQAVKGSDNSEPALALSVILCTLNGSATIGDQLEALIAQQTDLPFEVIVVDNGSTDGTGLLVLDFAGRDSRIRLESAPARRNLSYARNVGVAAASSQMLAFCDDDDLVDAGWVNAIAEALESNPLVGSRHEYSALNNDARLIGRSQFQSEAIGQMFGLPTLSGAGFGCQRWLWNATAGIDEYFGKSGEDFDFSMRAYEQLGIAPVLVRDAVYHYRLRSGGRGTFRQTRRYGESHAQLYKRHGRGRVDVISNAHEAVRDWWWIITRSPLAAVGIRRENWANRAGRRVGRAIGSLKYRVFWL